ncbi:hypothetical protein N234_16245 [Ralstonia pickettii DTP0602]|nr:hypothetical protein N234_16245 [Ralstonia pickettii DTP0602]
MSFAGASRKRQAGSQEISELLNKADHKRSFIRL